MSEAAHATAVFSQAALDQLDSLYSYALALTHDKTEAEDLVQETYLRAVKAFGQLVPNSNLKGWLFVIMRNVWLNEVRRERNGPHFIGLDEEQNELDRWPDQRIEDPHAIYLRKLQHDEIVTAIGSLPSLYREIIVLRDIEGFSYHEIATLLNCPAGTVMSRLGRARVKLRSLLSTRPAAEAAKAG